ncbi:MULTISPECIES: TetR/AcrR family transcriptional regulator [Alphaproteobacteria]|uniref:TetR family transcriptional regulator n=2 Tax=Alphaproteobacteria TaxID=28211 RepID=A0A512HEG2_9HYPH|nr:MULTISPECIES: TetR/AcrR family transcriptional regulator [Alphaproteobacteria]GEO83846.1 TetR family transcriptional regulator [Ciceribacter naphthalenivorans]GLR21276.1 TetR family transcriptional regulator [Ciceribacter naphthalenivorans]GLT04132.1 TetR family transcriptional regulator [Sphingomonas psychrolutea]
MARLVAERHDVIPQIAEIFREQGYEGTSLKIITERTGLGKGSLYHFFPGGKQEMAEAVLDDVDGWFRTHIFAPLREAKDPNEALDTMFANVETYFRSGHRACLMGVIASSGAIDIFAERVQSYFADWRRDLAATLARAGFTDGEAGALAEEVLAGIQGALILARGLEDTSAFTRVLARLKTRCRPALSR